MNRAGWFVSIVLFFAALASGEARVLNAGSQTAAAPETPATLVVKGAAKQELQLGIADLKRMVRQKVTAKGHDGNTHVYEGVTLAAILGNAGAPQAGDLRGASMALCLVAEGGDGYRAAFSLAELDADFAAEVVLVADTVDGKEIGADQGPLRLVVPGDKRQGRWVRMLKKLSVVNPGQ
jgi:DMSO/TMAO reductase YedYZ molybdopterin-dependent catalytic subunit